MHPQPLEPTTPVSSEGVVAAGVYVDGRRVANIAIEEASSWRSKPGHVVWIGLHEPDMTLLSSVQRQFELHDLAIEDADHAHQRPKIEQYGDALFIVARTAQLDGDSIAFGETHLFVGEGLSRLGPARRFDVLRAGARALRKLSAGTGPRARTTSSTPSSISSSTTTRRCSKPSRRKSKRWRHRCSRSAMTRAQIERLYLLRRDLLRLRNAVGPLVEVCRRLEHDNLPMVRSTMQPLFLRCHGPRPDGAGAN